MWLYFGEYHLCMMIFKDNAKKFIQKYTCLPNKICLNGLPENAPSSLHTACTELNRLKN